MSPLARPRLILWGFSLGAGPEDIPAVVLWRNLSASDWAEQIVRCLEQKENLKRTCSFKRREKERRKDFCRISQKISLWIPVVFMLKEILVHPAVLKLGYLWKLLTTMQVIRRALLWLALIVCKNRICPVALWWKMASRGERGRRVIWSRRWVFWCGSFWKKSLLVLKLEKIVYPEFILSWQELWFSVFRYCGKCFLAFFSDFISSPPLLFLKNTHKYTHNNNRAKRREKKRKFYY